MNINELNKYYSNLNCERYKMITTYNPCLSSPFDLYMDRNINDDSINSFVFAIHKKNLPRRYILNENACVCFWKDGHKTISIRHKEDKFDKSMGFLMCCFQYYNRDLSRNKRKKVLSWIKQENIKDYLFDLFVTENNMTIKEAEEYLKDLKTEKEIKNKIIREKQKKKAKHMKEDK